MRILLISIGTRGDVEPFLAIAELLKAKGHEIVCAFPEQFRKMTDDLNIEFHGLNPAFLELLHSKDGEVVMGGGKSLWGKILSFVRLAQKGIEVNKVMMAEQHEITESVQPDLIIHHNKAVYPIYKEVQDHIPQIIVSPVPYLIHHIKGYPHLGFRKKILGINIEKWSYSLANFGLLSFVSSWSKKLKHNKRPGRKALKDCLLNTPLIYTISPSLFSGEIDPDSPVKVLGYHEKSVETHWEPSDELQQFIQRHNKILFITFGSMTNPWPEKITRMFCEILSEYEIPAIINTAYGGLVKLDEYDNALIHFEEGLPYHWILPKMYGVVHHGGSGTTHLGAKYGCASMIIPHIVDQFMWNQLLYEKGIGPKGIKISKISKKKLASKILDLWTHQPFKDKAEMLSEEMQKEDFRSELVEALLTVKIKG
ncbi:glycosyltransferase family 1 protein [Marivirga sp. S37H4]|uniref:Glycosyltransferase family 1 protein n=1 Tax=Marivirga aurantiaca TaxID=2802615 RepID=A0A935C6G3_9BACT|nr:glycosyltransferase [Marivirga aurantiaca]MBK6264354.1 glycosyltransferase family 1 protein [Marivirga aurantiaca]